MSQTPFCPSCSRGIFYSDSFCAWCGTGIRTRPPAEGPSRDDAIATIPPPERQLCGSCNLPVLPSDLFCANCGARCSEEEPDSDFGDSISRISRRVTEAAGGRYEFIRLLGKGGMGIVLMARDVELDRLVAIKVLSPSWLTDESMVTRFQHEARTIASLRHESIVSVYDVGRAEEFYYFVMDFIEGVSLGEILRGHGPLPVPVVQAVLYQVGSALDYAHGRSNTIVHRDIKPANIMLSADGLAVLMDFGISKAGGTSSGLTRTGTVMGTPEYMSPEQCRGPTVTHASDQYSLGAVVFAMLTGAPPFTGPYYKVLLAHQSEDVPDLAELRPDCPSELVSAVERMLAKGADERFPSIGAVLTDLDLRPFSRGSPARVTMGEMVRETQAVHEEREKRTASEGTGEEGGSRTPTSLRIVPHTEELEVGERLGLSAVVEFPDGAEESGYDIAWESTDPSIVRVDRDSGRLVALGEGSAMVKAVGGGVSDLLSISVSPPKVVRVRITPEDPELKVGARLQLHAWPTTKLGHTLEKPVSWSSSDSRVASVSDTGKVTAHRGGTVSILAHSGGVGGAVTLTVAADAGAATPPGLDDGTRVVSGSAGGSTDRRSAETVIAASAPEEATPPAKNAVPIGGASKRDTDSGPERRWVPLAAVAVVVLLGGTFLLNRGTASDVSEVHAVEMVANGGPVGSAAFQLLVGDTLRLDARALGPDSAVLNRPLTWASRSPSVASVGGGMVIGRSEGDTEITAASGDMIASVPVVVRSPTDGDSGDAPAVEAITVRDASTGRAVTSLELEPRTPLRLQALPMDGAGTPVEGSSIAWTSSDPTVVAVDSRGIVVGVQSGRAEVIVGVDDFELRIPVGVTAPPTAAATPAPRDAPPPADGTLVLQVRPWAHVWIDDRREADEQRSFTTALAPGRHRLRLTHSTLPPFDTVFTIRSGQTTTLQIRLNRDSP